MTIEQQLINNALYGSNDSSQHQITLFALAISLRSKNILELGVRHGETTIPLLAASNYTTGKVTSIDIEENKNLYSLQSQYPQWNYVIEDSIEFLKKIPKNEIYDFIFIDDWHDGEHLYKEIQLIESHITPSSLILIHDCMCYNTQPNYHIWPRNLGGEFGNGGPFAAIEKLDKSIWEYSTIPVNHGLTLLRKVGEISEFAQ